MASSSSSSRKTLVTASKGGVTATLFSVAILAVVCALAFDALHLQLKRSGMRDLLKEFIDPADTRIRKHYTGVAAVDKLLFVLVVFFLNVLDPSRPETFLFVVQFAGQLVAPVIFGYAVAFPIFAIAHLVFSPTDAQSLSLRDPSRLTVVVPAILLGYLVPTLLQLLPLEDYSHQTAIAIWQPFPVYTFVLSWAFSHTAQRLTLTTGGAPDKNDTDRNAVDTAYDFVLAVGAISHWATIASIVAVSVQPELFPPSVAESLTLAKVFVPKPIRSYGPASLPEICKQFLQWDYIFGSAASLIWAASLAARVGAWSFSPAGTVSILRYIVIYGPSAAAAALMKRRDAVVYGA
ncbi:hypothetical protein GMORB2_7698 [Geosmithia morbida]|uniref:Uncharacterized protein n=1 Tax=Geosmithia morbida TaxID=1094350 RepID=A0A9P5D3T1_9HYPO|nr:uncharacterized protein GMORB2_7698 [Geosmithia morbida]KAF4122105.1 hypothetical protein GMORB2_7698 [Geosmithia morbida]